MKNKKIVSLLLVGALMAGMFTVTGCGGSSDGKTACILFLPEMDHERCCCRSSQVRV